MTIVDVLRVLRRNLVIIVIGAIIGAMVALAYVMTRPTRYVASSTGVVVAGDSLSVGDTMTANSLTVQRAGLYANLIGTSAVGKRADEALSKAGHGSAASGALSASSGATNPFIYVTATGSTAAGAQQLANAGLAALRSEALHLETFPKTQGKGDQSDAALEKQTSIHILTYAPAGLPGAPAKPHLVRNLALGAIAGAIVAGAIALIRRSFDGRVRSQTDVEQVAGTAALAVVPDSKTLAKTGSSDVVGGAAGEAIRQLRTNLRFVSVDKPPRSLVITSPTPGDGKSTIAANLARLMAAAGESVVLIDCDLRRPTQADQFAIDGAVGLTQVLAGDIDVDSALVQTDLDGLQVLPAGRIPPNPSELLGSQTMRTLVEALSAGHVVILDAPPVLAVTDAALVGALADGVILVTRMGTNHKAQLQQCAKLLRQANSTLLGAVLNRASLKSMGDAVYGYGYGYGSYGNFKRYQGYYTKPTRKAKGGKRGKRHDESATRTSRRGDKVKS